MDLSICLPGQRIRAGNQFLHLFDGSLQGAFRFHFETGGGRGPQGCVLGIRVQSAAGIRSDARVAASRATDQLLGQEGCVKEFSVSENQYPVAMGENHFLRTPSRKLSRSNMNIFLAC